ncbi:ATP-grasp superfamily protein [Mycena venus]|uniref:ATP-grasp superfamily protein n=1 Tax=Mycena venus TaxID=2733690 RepID=A0A8H6XJB4_9AGAR|nr:ATP-grasp superfamily protein [Mycena venus]
MFLETATTTTLILDDGRPVEAIWRINPHPPAATFQTIDVILRPSTVNAANPQIALAEANLTDNTHKFLLRCIRLVVTSARSIKLILPTADGFVGRGNFFERRLLECGFVERVEGFLALDQRTRPVRAKALLSEGFLSVISSAAAGILLQHSDEGSDAERFGIIEAELASRLALNWIFPNPAVKDFNVSVIVLGAGEPHAPKHWLQYPENAPGFCDAFIPIDMTIDEDLPGRIVAAVRAYRGFEKIDGILTAHDRYLVSTAKAAVILGLPVSPIRAHEVATDKYAMRQFEVDSQGNDFQFFCFADLEDIQTRLCSTEHPLVVDYPAIVKPVSGYLSEGVAKVNNDAELLASVGKIDTKRHGHAVIVETYIDGPEFDANIVICEGKILFFELVDDFPSSGDTAAGGGTFFETSEFTPSNLPSSEREIVKSSLHKTLLGLGFTWGLFHVEGRVKDSTMEFRADESGIVDLRTRLVPRGNSPSCFLVEINARIPGLGCAMSTIHSYGVDFYAAHLLSCLRDAERLRLVTTAFNFPERPDGSQYWCEVVFIQPDRGGRFATEDPCGELLQRYPALKANVSRHLCCYAKGDIIPDPATGVCLLLAYFLAYSRKSRQHVREVSEMIRAEFRYEIDEIVTQ